MDLPENKQIIIFDGVCNLCNASVQFIIKNDKKDVFRFTSNQSVIGQQILKFANIDIFTTDSIILFDGEKNFVTESDAALKIAKELGGVYQYFYYLIFLPKKFRDFFYKYIAVKQATISKFIIGKERSQTEFLTLLNLIN